MAYKSLFATCFIFCSIPLAPAYAGSPTCSPKSGNPNILIKLPDGRIRNVGGPVKFWHTNKSAIRHLRREAIRRGDTSSTQTAGENYDKNDAPLHWDDLRMPLPNFDPDKRLSALRDALEQELRQEELQKQRQERDEELTRGLFRFAF